MDQPSLHHYDAVVSPSLPTFSQSLVDWDSFFAYFSHFRDPKTSLLRTYETVQLPSGCNVTIFICLCFALNDFFEWSILISLSYGTRYYHLPLSSVWEYQVLAPTGDGRRFKMNCSTIYIMLW